MQFNIDRQSSPSEKNTGGIGGKIFGFLFGFAFFSMGSFFIVMMVGDFWEKTQTHWWEPTPATITQSYVQTSGDKFKVSYNYTYEGYTYSGNTYTLDYTGSESYSDAQELQSTYPEGSTQTCYVNPQNPRNVILEHFSLFMWLFMLIPLIFVLIGGAIMVGVWLPESKKSTASKAHSHTKSENSTFWATLILSIVFTLIGVSVSAFWTVPILTEVVSAQTWDVVDCKILRSKVKSHRSDDGTTYSVDIVYEYHYQGQTYRSGRYGFIGGSSSGRSGKIAIVKKYQRGSTQLCYVNPTAPSKAVLQRGFNASLLLTLIPLIFLAIGLAIAFYNFKLWLGIKKEQRSHASWKGSTPHTQNTSNPIELKPSTGRISGLIVTICIAAFWNGIVSVFLWQCIDSFQGGNGDWFLALFLIPFVAIGAGLICWVVYTFLCLFNPTVKMTLMTPDLALGWPVRVQYELQGSPRSIQSLLIYLEGKEEIQYIVRSGKNSSKRTESSVFFEQELINTTNIHEIESGSVECIIPMELMHSFETEGHKIIWSLKLKGEVPNWPDISEDYLLQVRPVPYEQDELVG